MGLGLLISGLIFGGAAISAGIDNAKMMSEPYRYLEDGTPVYLDRKCKEHINGEKVISKAVHDSHGNIKLVSVGQRSGRVYFDPEEAQRRRMDEMSEKYRKFYVKPDFDFYNCHCKADGDEGIEITREEFNKLNIVGGSHMACCY